MRGGDVLVVEDDPDLRAVIARVLERAGHRVRTAADGREALELAVEQPPGLVLLDLRLAGMGGPEFARRFRAVHGDEVPLVMVTGAAEARAAMERIGARAALEKPFRLPALLEVVERHLEQPSQPRPGP